MNLIDRPAFERNMAELFGALNQPLSETAREGWWKGLAKMTLPDFGRCCDRLIADCAEEDGPRQLSVRDVWGVQRRLQARGEPAQHQGNSAVSGGPVDPWKQAGIARAGSHFCRHLPKYAHPADLPPSLGGTMALGPLAPSWQPHPVTIELRDPLWEAGEGWAQDMRDMTRSLGGAPPKPDQDAVWNSWLLAADRKVDAVRSRHELGEPVQPKGDIVRQRILPPIRPRTDSVDATEEAA